VHVITKDNREYRGILDHATIKTGGDILLNGPTMVVNGVNEIEKKIGEILLIRGTNISCIIFQGDIIPSR
jgi:small nuclear ribonucleoprotein (snRNP)-like protein